MATQNKVRNSTMDEANKTALANFPETVMWRSLRPIDTPVVEPQNEFAGARSPTVPDDSDVQVPVKHDFSGPFFRCHRRREGV